MSGRVVLDAVVRAPVEASFAALTDWPGQGMWMLGTQVRVTGGDGVSIGSRIEATTGKGALAVTDVMVITAWDAPHRVDVDHVGGLLKGNGSMRVLPLPHGMSRVVWMEDLDLPLGPVGRISWTLVRPGFMVGVRRSLQSFATLVETGALPREPR